MEEKSSLVSQLAANTDVEIAKRISESVTSYVTESNEDTFKSDTIFDNFHHQAKIPISERALLVEFLMLWLKWCIVPTLPHEVADVVYLTVLLTYGRSLGLLPAMEVAFKVGFRYNAEAFAMWQWKKTEKATWLLCRW